MQRQSYRLLTIHLVFCLLLIAACSDPPPPPPRESSPPAHGTIVAMGDSLTEGLGVEEEWAYPALLEDKLTAAGFSYRVVNAGVSGETSSGALSRVKWVMSLEPDIVILETGANRVGFRLWWWDRLLPGSQEGWPDGQGDWCRYDCIDDRTRPR